MHLSTNKPAYKPGEELLISCWLLRAQDQAPFGRAHSTETAGSFKLQVKGAKGDVVHEKSLHHERGESTLSARWTIPTDTVGGEFVASLTPQERWGGSSYGTAGAERAFTVRVQVRVTALAALATCIRKFCIQHFYSTNTIKTQPPCHD